MRHFIRIATAAILTTASVQTAFAPAQAAKSGIGASSETARFRAFFDGFRKAVLANDRDAVADMTLFPFKDFRSGHYCEPGLKDCTVSADTAFSRNRAQFLARYDRIFTPAVIAAIRSNRIRGFRPGHDDDEQVGGPIEEGEYLLDAPEAGDQRVFVPVGTSWKLARIPFYS